MEEVACALAVSGQHKYVGVYYRKLSLAEFRREKRGWTSVYAPPRSFIWLGFDDLVEKGLCKEKIFAALSVLCEASVACTNERSKR